MQDSNEQFVGFFSQFSAFSNFSVSVLTIGALADARRSAEFRQIVRAVYPALLAAVKSVRQR
jgi:hypothetical protein